jgi:hypothetical protein
MFCPNCRTEYRPGFSKCSDCGAGLVESLDAVSTNRPPAGGGPQLLWTGTDPAAFGVITNALDDADIPHHESSREVGAIPGLAPPVNAIFVPAHQADAARAAMDKAIRELQNGSRDPDALAASELSEPDFPEEDEEDDASPAPDDIVEDYDPEQATLEVWSGSDADTKDMLVASLRENGIGCEVESAGTFRMFVMPQSERRAREIIREVIDASAPS